MPAAAELPPMEDRILAAVGDQYTSFSDLVTAVEGDAGEAFLTCRRLVRDGVLETTGPMVYRLTDEGRDRLERARDRRSAADDTLTIGQDDDPDDEETADDDATESQDDADADPAEASGAFDFGAAYADALAERRSGGPD
jgi:hypothetical protein